MPVYINKDAIKDLLLDAGETLQNTIERITPISHTDAKRFTTKADFTHYVNSKDISAQWPFSARDNTNFTAFFLEFDLTLPLDRKISTAIIDNLTEEVQGVVIDKIYDSMADLNNDIVTTSFIYFGTDTASNANRQLRLLNSVIVRIDISNCVMN